ncbi:hypothetical protein B0A48_16470 [Cryoendolithus antarcticus]|uniref:Uncharacterized protein n=1 Tax=Cryoendolithus antarcticus TaxID=1507870 RepID=A0A1V8SEM6_9PEZI|nr:hypothetical protein B0A48_16470 [Cryoendolithus antarcticus]
MGAQQRDEIIHNFAQEIRRDVWHGYPSTASLTDSPRVLGGSSGNARGVLPVDFGYGAAGQRERGGSVVWFAGGGVSARSVAETEYLARRARAWGMGSRVPDGLGSERGMHVYGRYDMEMKEEAEIEEGEVEEYVVGRPESPGRGM